MRVEILYKGGIKVFENISKVFPWYIDCLSICHHDWGLSFVLVNEYKTAVSILPDSGKGLFIQGPVVPRQEDVVNSPVYMRDFLKKVM